MIDGIWWVVILCVLMVVLFALAKWKQASSNSKFDSIPDSIKSSSGKRESPAKNKQKSTPLSKLYGKLSNQPSQQNQSGQQNQPSPYNFHLRDNHILVSKQQQKIAMITLDKNKATEVRRLGEVTVFNFDKMPSVERVAVKLSELG